MVADYIGTFDHRKRFSPYLTYFAYGDTRKRGMALLRFKHAYRTAGLALDDSSLMVTHRAGLEFIRLGLHEAGSPWAHVLESVSATLPPLGRREHETVARLAAEGPPEEEVGLVPFAPPE